MYKRHSNINSNQIEKRLKKYNETSPIRRNAVVCVNCGSTRIDQNAIHQLRCYDCNEIMAWNGLRFTISREHEGIDDVGFALRNLNNSSYDEWHKQLEDGLYLFLQKIVVDAKRSENFTKERLETLQKDWEHCKNVVDMYFRDRQQYDEELS